ncbi:phosphotransferase [Actinomadura sp. DC4]|uniref:phosphotransferase n=1 Tax=Actinomadura sp. DC4 TaxID=3055069 RepID=UPI0025B02E8C|nr:phosphotransferase [Actinomadura sp. DC4]MDN3358505.1 phosphotransferase [Actinomadura sp. DC4]
MLTRQSLCAWCESALGARVVDVVRRTGHLSQVLVVVLADGRQVVVKVRPFEPRLRGCVEVQRSLAAGGFPCPAPLAGPDLIDTLAVTAETLADVGVQHGVADGAEAFAGLLARLVAAAPAPAAVPSLDPSPPWNGWDHGGAELWPDRDDEGRNLNRVGGPAWLDRAAADVRRLLRDHRAPDRVGHGDWESQNIRWLDDEATAVHDWDSVIAQPEAAIVGFASAVWTKQGKPDEVASVEQSSAFLDAYERAAGVRWTRPARRAAWAAGLWVRLFDAKMEAASGGGPELDRLSGEVARRLERAGLPA